jgi:hypothetical protein
VKVGELTLQDLARGLEEFGERYDAINVFADDVRELATDEPVTGAQALDETNKHFQVSVGAESYRLDIFDDGGVRLSRTTQRLGAGGGGVLGRAAGAALDAAATKKGVPAAPVVGLLTGGLIANTSSRHVLTLRFDPATRQWGAYDGGLVSWMKQQLNYAG